MVDLFQIVFAPNVAHASVDSILADINRLIINPLIQLLFALAIAFFLFGVFQFLANQENEEKKTAGKKHMIWGIVGLTIMMGVWTILNIVLKTFDIDYVIPEEGKVDISEEMRDYDPQLLR